MGDLLEKINNLFGAYSDKLLLDVGYFHDSVIAETKKYQIQLFCSENSNRPISRKIYPKCLFVYNAEQDNYTCPAQHQLSLKSTVTESEKTQGCQVYACIHCDQCGQQKQCKKRKLAEK